VTTPNLDLDVPRPDTNPSDLLLLEALQEEHLTDDLDISVRYAPHSMDKSGKFLENFYHESIKGITRRLSSKYQLNARESRTLSTLEHSDVYTLDLQKALEDANSPNLWIRILLFLAAKQPTDLCWILPSLYSDSLMPPDGCIDVIVCAYYQLALIGVETRTIPLPFYQILIRMVPKLGSGLLHRLPLHAITKSCPHNLRSAVQKLVHEFRPAHDWESGLALSQVRSNEVQLEGARSSLVSIECDSLALYSVEFDDSLRAFTSTVEREFLLGNLTAEQVETHLTQILKFLRNECHPSSLRHLIKAAQTTKNPGVVGQIIRLIDSHPNTIRDTVLIQAIRTLKSLNVFFDVPTYPGIIQWVSRNHQIATEIMSTRRLYLESNGVKDVYNLILPYFELWFDSRVLQALGLPVSRASDHSKLEPDVVVMTVMLDSYFEQCEYDESVVRETYRRFKRALLIPEFNKILTGVGPGVFNVLIHAFAKLKVIDIDVCLSLTGDINRLVSGGDEPLTVNSILVRKRHAGTDHVSLLVLLMALSWGGHLKAAEAVLKQIWRQYPASFGAASNVVISGYVKIGDDRRAQELATLRELAGFAADEYTKRALSGGVSASDEALLGPPSLVSSSLD
jgi:hypothetical protein